MVRLNRYSIGLLLVTVASVTSVSAQNSAENNRIFARENLVAWCIVPFDGKQRGPIERAQMLQDLGLHRVAYDWRAEHVPTFEQEILEYKKRGLEYFAFWGVHDEAFRLFQKHQLSPQIWQIIPQPAAADQLDQVKEAAEKMLPLVDRTRRMGSKLGLYNHGGWSGLPENMVAVCRYLQEHYDADHVGIVYNLHHSHPVIDRFAESLRLMKPYLLCLNLNGMSKSAEVNGQKILPVGAGDLDASLLKTIRNSGYDGPVGIIGHTQDDVQQRLQDNLDGIDWLLPQIDGKTSGKRPDFRTWKLTQPDTKQDVEYSTKLVEKLVVSARP